jgi:NadR type nicotinamide-nucleotide adenylyltransferase
MMTTGFILGKFLPPHKGHLHLIDHARRRVDHLTVLVCSIKSQPIPGELRYRWLKELCPDVNVQHCDDEIPQYPEEHPDFWAIWTRTIRRFCPVGPDVVFTSETYGDRLAECLGARHELVDLARARFPISGTQIRADPRLYWEFIPDIVRPYFTQRLDAHGMETIGPTASAI